jgi:SAM-dependent methyltransferase
MSTTTRSESVPSVRRMTGPRRARPRVLVVIANHGTKNDRFRDRLIVEYQQMQAFQVSVVVVSDRDRSLGSDVEVRVGAPARDPWSLPFAHRRVFAERRHQHDLFVYSEDDTMLTEQNLRAFLEVSRDLPDGKIAGFLRYERAGPGERWFNDAAFGFRWDTCGSFLRSGHLYARFTNPHSACYVLTRSQLQRCIDSGGFLVRPHAGRFDMLVSAATDPYTRCGFEKVIPIDRLEDFLVHHLPDRYVGRMGQSEADVRAQLEELRRLLTEGAPPKRLFRTEKRIPTVAWDKRYDEPPLPELKKFLPRRISRVLAVGTGLGLLEESLVGGRAELTAIPLDDVVAAAARRRGIRTMAADLDRSISELDGIQFDLVLLVNVLHHLSDPTSLLRRIHPLISQGGRALIVAPNMRRAALRRLSGRRSPVPVPRGYAKHGLHWTDGRVVRHWCRGAGLLPVEQEVLTTGPARDFGGISGWLGTDVVVAACPR